jgi:hypothetical protein
VRLAAEDLPVHLDVAVGGSRTGVGGVGCRSDRQKAHRQRMFHCVIPRPHLDADQLLPGLAREADQLEAQTRLDLDGGRSFAIEQSDGVAERVLEVAETTTRSACNWL